MIEDGEFIKVAIEVTAKDESRCLQLAGQMKVGMEFEHGYNLVETKRQWTSTFGIVRLRVRWEVQ